MSRRANNNHKLEVPNAAPLRSMPTCPSSTLETCSPDVVPRVIQSAVAQRYRVLMIDSLSHFWSGTDGELDQVEKVKRRLRDNGFAAWREVTPKHNRMIDAILGAPIHILVSLRVKTEWVVETDERTGKTKPRKIGLQPVMRDGIEYEFDVCGDMDQEHTLVITKSRCPKLAGGAFSKPAKSWQTLSRRPSRRSRERLACQNTTASSISMASRTRASFAVRSQRAYAPRTSTRCLSNYARTRRRTRAV